MTRYRINSENQNIAPVVPIRKELEVEAPSKRDTARAMSRGIPAILPDNVKPMMYHVKDPTERSNRVRRLTTLIIELSKIDQ